MKKASLIKMCLNKTYSKAHIGKHLSYKFSIQNGLKQEILYHHCFSTLLLNIPLEGPEKPGGTDIIWGTSSCWSMLMM
jgi:hypothetical protein